MTIEQLPTKHFHPDGEFILAHVLKKPREFVIAHPEYTLNFFEVWNFKKCVRARKRGVPFAYITGHKEFFGFDFVVNKYTLVPRPDTEVLVELVLEELDQKKESEKILLIDVGTGSGCIPVAIEKTFDKNPSKKNILQTLATDISSRALKVAKHNAHMQNVDITFFQGNLLEPLLKNFSFETKYSSTLITANLPYLTQKQFDEEPSIQKEPHSALVAHENGLELYKKLCKQIADAQKQNIFVSPITMYFEIDPSQTELLTQFVKNTFENGSVEVKRDYCGVERIAIIKI